MLADGAVAWWPNPIAFDPTTECVAVEDAVAITDDVFRRAGATNRSAQESTQSSAIRLVGEHADIDDAAREMIHDDCHPPAVRPVLRHGERQPTTPETGADRYGCQVDMPDVIGFSGRDNTAAV